MASSSSVPQVCAKCQAKPTYNAQGFAKGAWSYRSRQYKHQVIWYTLCPTCDKEVPR